MMTSIAPEPKGSSRTKEILIFSLIGLFVLIVLMLPSLSLLYLNNKKPELGQFFKYASEKTKTDIINEINTDSIEPYNEPIQTNTNTQNTATITQAITDVYTKNGLQLSLFTYPAQCNVARITGDYVQFNSIKCYSESEIGALRGSFKVYFDQATPQTQLNIIETSILRIIGQGTPYPPVSN